MFWKNSHFSGLILSMRKSKTLHTRQIDKRVFDQDIKFPHTTNLTPTLKTDTDLEHIRKTSIENSLLSSRVNKTQVKREYFQLLKKIQFLENNFQWILECLKQTIKDHNKQYDELFKKVQTVKKKDEQIEMLMERQDQMVLVFQQKIHQLQKVIKQQEDKLINTQSALSEARQHLERIKNNK